MRWYQALGLVLAVSTTPAVLHAQPGPPDEGYYDDDEQATDDGAYDYEDDNEIDDATFEHELSSDGRWTETAEYGRVWVPNVQRRDREWRPYLYGRWAWTDQGWTWASDEPFGWAVYHYGRWDHLPRVGWVWVPGRKWAPAWVAWRNGDDTVGWSPLPPRATSFAADIRFEPTRWVFVHTPSFYGKPVQRVWVRDPVEMRRYWSSTRWTPNWRRRDHNAVYTGPSVSIIRRHAPVHTAVIERSTSRGPARISGSNRIQLYRAPSRITAPQEVGRDRRGIGESRGRPAQPPPAQHPSRRRDDRHRIRVNPS